MRTYTHTHMCHVQCYCRHTCSMFSFTLLELFSRSSKTSLKWQKWNWNSECTLQSLTNSFPQTFVLLKRNNNKIQAQTVHCTWQTVTLRHHTGLLMISFDNNNSISMCMCERQCISQSFILWMNTIQFGIVFQWIEWNMTL